MADPSNMPPAKYYTFDCMRGYYCEPSGLPWSPVNPNYDPGPLPPPSDKPKKERKPRDKHRQSETPSNDAGTSPPPMSNNPMAQVQRFESVQKIAHSTWLRQQSGRPSPRSFHNQPGSGNNQGVPSYVPTHGRGSANHPAGSSKGRPPPNDRGFGSPRGRGSRHGGPAANMFGPEPQAPLSPTSAQWNHQRQPSLPHAQQTTNHSQQSSSHSIPAAYGDQRAPPVRSPRNRRGKPSIVPPAVV